MKIATISGLKRALGVVVGQITDALAAVHSALSGAVAAESQRAQQAEAGLTGDIAGILPRLAALESALANTAAALDPQEGGKS